ncbi:sugar transporter [Pandoraea captiosa]|uniref:Sugar transporter n=2 Tax=Pandoraea captiosa TaxID=2508302 RepID=A0A5E5ALR6_9BURK|nr:sugar transporter [Pandoraea captiosa]
MIPRTPARFVKLLLSVSMLTTLAGCSLVPSSGPTRSQVENEAQEPSGLIDGIQIVDVSDAVARKLLAQRRSTDFASTFGDAMVPAQRVGTGDILEVSVWESPPAALFSAPLQPELGTGASRAVVLPAQTVDTEGEIDVPFAGRVPVTGRTINEVSGEIAKRLKNKANQPQVMTRVVKRANAFVTVVGDVNSSVRMELSAGNERLLDSLAAAGGTRQAVDKTTIQVTRGRVVQSLPLQSIIRDPRQNIPLHAHDVVTALFQPYSFTMLGASGKNDEVNFEAQGITLSQALARSGGLNDSRSDPRGVFVFRFESPEALDWPNAPVKTTPNGKVPVIYRVDLKNPSSFFVAQNFMMDDKDLVYVSNAPVAELQKFMNLVFSGLYPTLSVINATK